MSDYFRATLTANLKMPEKSVVLEQKMFYPVSIFCFCYSYLQTNNQQFLWDELKAAGGNLCITSHVWWSWEHCTIQNRSTTIYLEREFRTHAEQYTDPSQGLHHPQMTNCINRWWLWGYNVINRLITLIRSAATGGE